MSMVFLYNNVCTFNNKNGAIEFQQTKWFMPIEAIKSIKITEVKDKKIEFEIKVD